MPATPTSIDLPDREARRDYVRSLPELTPAELDALTDTLTQIELRRRTGE